MNTDNTEFLFKFRYKIGRFKGYRTLQSNRAMLIRNSYYLFKSEN